MSARGEPRERIERQHRSPAAPTRGSVNWLRIRKGRPDDGEVAAVTVVLLAVAGSAPPGGAVPTVETTSRWRASARPASGGVVQRPGRGAWRASALPTADR